MTTPKKTPAGRIAPLSGETVAISHLEIPEFEATGRWIRAKYAGKTIADTTRAMILRRANRLPVYCFPREDVLMELLEETDHKVDLPPQGTASFWNVRVGSMTAEKAAYGFVHPAGANKALKDYVILEWGKMDGWFEEDEEVFVHLRDPYHRIDVLDSSRHVRIVVGGETVAETRQAVFLFETGFPTRYYVPEGDVRMDVLESVDLQTRCPYKGIATSYWTIKVEGKVLKNSVWSYRDPLPHVRKIKGHLCFYNERVEAIYVDEELMAKPITPWST